MTTSTESPFARLSAAAKAAPIGGRRSVAPPRSVAERIPGIRARPWPSRHHERVHRIAVVGCIGSGKSTAARTLA